MSEPIDAVTIVRPTDLAGCIRGVAPSVGPWHDWHYQYGTAQADPPGRVERFVCSRCPAIEDRLVPPLAGVTEVGP